MHLIKKIKTAFVVTLSPVFVSVLAIAVLLSSSSIAFADTLPFSETFSGSKPASWILSGDAAWAASHGGDSTLRLTSNAPDQSGLGFYDQSFASNLGIVSEFTYYANEGDGADGLVFFLVDGDQVSSTTIATGALGGSLGYAQSASDNGVPHAYLGVGFDEYGNFVTSDDGKSGGIGRTPNSVALRGGGNGQVGYDYLTSVDVHALYGHETDTGWRSARVTVIPHTSSATVRVEMSFDGGTTWLPVIDDYTYNETPPENLKLGFTGGTGGSTNVHAIGNLNVTIPADLALSVTASPSGTFARGDTVQYSYTLVNNGPNTSGVVSINNTLTQGEHGLTDVQWSYNTSTGSSSYGNGNSIGSIPVNLAVGATATVTVTGKIGSELLNTDSITIGATVVANAGVNDPDSSNNTISIPITTTGPTSGEAASISRIVSYASSNGLSAVPAMSDFTDLGIVGVTGDNFNEILRFIKNMEGADVNTVGKIQGAVTQYLSTRKNAVAYSVAQRYGCKDKNATNYEYFAAENNSLCKYNSIVTYRDSAKVGTPVSASVTVVATSSSKSIVVATTTGGILIETIPNLRFGSENRFVLALQKFLISKTTGSITPAAARLATRGANGYFGPATRSALIEYQKTIGVKPAIGHFGPLTRAMMKSLGVNAI